MATQPALPEVKQALLFMPDISGFTKFVNDTEILHSQHIIQELLEILIDSNKLGLELNEIEGDAILFYKAGDKPSLTELLKQVETMYINFHRHLQLYDHQRICNCGACQSAINLKLKAIAHYGEITLHELRGHKVLFGKDVIILHRLLKNNIGKDEYILMTEPLKEAAATAHTPAWYSPEQGSGVYDTGDIQFGFSLLDELGKNIPPPEIPAALSTGTMISFTEEGVVPADMNKIFGTIVDLSQRPHWMAGVRGIEMLNHEKINRAGTQHLCIVNPKKNPVIVTESATQGSDKMELVEMQSTGMGGCRYRLQKIAPEQTKISIEVLVKKNPFIRIMFNLMMKNKFQKSVQQSLINLKAYCQSPVPELSL